MGLDIDLKGRRVLVAGASSGVGRSTALAIAAHGGQIAVVGRRAALLTEVVTAAGGGVAIQADLTDEVACAGVVETATTALGGLDAVLLPVGASPLQVMTRLTAETWFHDYRRSYATNARRRGIDERTIMRQTGHKTRSAFDRYNIVDDSDQRAAVTKYEAAIFGHVLDTVAKEGEFRNDEGPQFPEGLPGLTQ